MQTRHKKRALVQLTLETSPLSNKRRKLNEEIATSDENTFSDCCSFDLLPLDLFRLICRNFSPHDLDLSSLSRVNKQCSMFMAQVFVNKHDYQRVDGCYSPSIGRYLPPKTNLYSGIRDRWGLHVGRTLPTVRFGRLTANAGQIHRLETRWRNPFLAACVAGDTNSALNLFNLIHDHIVEAERLMLPSQEDTVFSHAIPQDIWTYCLLAPHTQTLDTLLARIAELYPDIKPSRAVTLPQFVHKHPPTPGMLIRFLRFHTSYPQEAFYTHLTRNDVDDLADVNSNLRHWSNPQLFIKYMLADPTLCNHPIVVSKIRQICVANNHTNIVCPANQFQLQNLANIIPDIHTYWSKIFIFWTNLPDNKDSAHVLSLLLPHPLVESIPLPWYEMQLFLIPAMVHAHVGLELFQTFWSHCEVQCISKPDEPPEPQGWIDLKRFIKHVFDRLSCTNYARVEEVENFIAKLTWLIRQHPDIRFKVNFVSQYPEIMDACLNFGIRINHIGTRAEEYQKMENLKLKDRLWESWTRYATAKTDPSTLLKRVSCLACSAVSLFEYWRASSLAQIWSSLLLPNNTLHLNIVAHVIEQFDLKAYHIFGQYTWSVKEFDLGTIMTRWVDVSRNVPVLKYLIEKLPHQPKQWVKAWEASIDDLIEIDQYIEMEDEEEDASSDETLVRRLVDRPGTFARADNLSKPAYLERHALVVEVSTFLFSLLPRDAIVDQLACTLITSHRPILPLREWMKWTNEVQALVSRFEN